MVTKCYQSGAKMGWEHASLKLAFLVCFWQKTKQYSSITNAAKFHNKTKRLQKFQNRSERLRQIWFWRLITVQEWRMKVRYLICLNLNLRQSLMMMLDRHHGKDPGKERSQFTNLLVRNDFWILIWNFIFIFISVEQMEFYMGDANVSRSKFMKEEMQKSPWVDLDVFLTFNKLNWMLVSIKEIDYNSTSFLYSNLTLP